MNGSPYGAGEDLPEVEALSMDVLSTRDGGSNLASQIKISGPSEDSGPRETAVPDSRRPTRGYQALLLLSGFMMTFQVIGLSQAYGVFQEFYTSPKSNISDAVNQDALVSLVGTLGAGLTYSGSIFVNPLIGRVKNTKLITVSGVFIMSLGLFLASYSTKLWQLYLTQALLFGIGSSMYYFPILSMTPVYFDRHRGFAMGVVVAGSGVGGLVFAPVLRLLLDRYGLRWALRIIAISSLVVGLPVACVVKQRPGYGASAGRRRTRVDMALVKRSTFVYQSLAVFLQASGNVVPLIYLTTYSTSVLEFSSSTGSLLLALNNAVNSVSRVAMGILADRVGRQNTMIASVLLSGLSVFALWYDAPRARFLAFVILYGIYAGGYNALLPTTITEIYGVQHYATVNGAIYFIRGVGIIFGGPVAGVILGSHKRSGGGDALTMGLGMLRKRYNGVVLFDGALLVSAGLCIAYVRWLDAREKGAWRWKA